MAGFSEIGRKQYGCFPLKGKMINVKKNSLRKNLANTEIANLVKILGLPHPGGSSVGNVRGSAAVPQGGHRMRPGPGRVAHQGTHHQLLPHVLSRVAEERGISQRIPHPHCRRKVPPGEAHVLHIARVQHVRRSAPAGWKFKWYKGLGTSNASEAKDYFRHMDRHLKPFPHTESATTIDRCCNVAFSDEKEFKELRKKMVCLSLDESGDLATTFEEFFTKELPVFWRDDNERSMTNVVDGLKVSQRKILYSALEKGLWGEEKEVRVAQLSGFHVGVLAVPPRRGLSLNAAIVKMAQDFMGSNNVNFLVPNGQLGTRLQNGKDAASERYIHVLAPDLQEPLPCLALPRPGLPGRGRETDRAGLLRAGHPFLPDQRRPQHRYRDEGLRAVVSPKDVVRAVERVGQRKCSGYRAVVPRLSGKDGARGRRLQV